MFIPPPVDRREDIPEAELPPHKRLCLTALTSRYEVEESSTAAPRPTRGHKIDYGFIDTLDAETRRQRAEEVGYGIRDVWVDPIKAVEEVALTTLEGVNDRVTELATVQEQDIHDVYVVIEDTQDRQTQLFHELYDLSGKIFHYESCTTIGSRGPHAGLPYRHTGVTDDDINCTGFITTGTVVSNNMPPRRSSATTRAAANVARAVVVAAMAATPMIAAAGTEGVVVLSQWFEKMESVFYISNCAVENQVKFATCTFLRNALTWWNSYMKTVTQDVAYTMD
ncbi:hypothetical protein Tco_0991819 [Tanacetum coccineum]|uniref:Reverse transcriptase domain-containing protein n=1 Tax=Tanacetum coccineum TaxID=301880 RepID=A0ABQ5F0K3_9ASTR